MGHIAALASMHGVGSRATATVSGAVAGKERGVPCMAAATGPAGLAGLQDRTTVWPWPCSYSLCCLPLTRALQATRWACFLPYPGTTQALPRHCHPLRLCACQHLPHRLKRLAAPLLCRALPVAHKAAAQLPGPTPFTRVARSLTGGAAGAAPSPPSASRGAASAPSSPASIPPRPAQSWYPGSATAAPGATRAPGHVRAALPSTPT